MTRLEDRQTLIGQIAEARGNGARQAPACALAGIDPRTLQRWRKNDGRRDPGEDFLQGGDLVLPPLRMLFRGDLDG